MGSLVTLDTSQKQKEQTWFEEKNVFRDQFGNRLIRVTEITGAKKVMLINSEEYMRYLRRVIYVKTGFPPEDKVIKTTVKTLDSMAEIAPVFELHQRIAQAGATIYIDLADEEGDIVEVNPDGWKVLTDAPVRFRQKKGEARQAMPVRSRDTTPSLFNFINIQDPSDQLLFEVTLLTCLIPKIAHPVIILMAGEGSAKTTASRVLKALIDPAAADLTKFPTKELDLGLICCQNHLVAFDNMSEISRAQSDLLCQVVTGGNISVRKLYTTDDTVTIPLQSCLVLNGIDITGHKKDLLDRYVIFNLPEIDPGRRKDETDFWQEFNAVKSVLLGRYFDVLAQAIKIYPYTKPEKKPRMADYYRWALAVTEALGRDPEEFEQAYWDNISRIVLDSVEQDPLAVAISSLVQEKPSWSGTISELHNDLFRHGDSRQLPKAPNRLSRELKLAAGTLGKVGIKVRWDKDRVKNLTTVQLEKAS